MEGGEQGAPIAPPICCHSSSRLSSPAPYQFPDSNRLTNQGASCRYRSTKTKTIQLTLSKPNLTGKFHKLSAR
jgi:hypothetical protein